MDAAHCSVPGLSPAGVGLAKSIWIHSERHNYKRDTLKSFDRTQDIFPLFFYSLTFYIYKSFPEAKKGKFILILYSHVHFKG